MRGQSYVILALIFVIIVAIFAVINVDPVEVNYLFGSGEAPLILVILFSVLMGGIITAAVGLVRMIHLQRERKSLLAENKRLIDTLESHQLLDEVDTNNQDANDSEEK
ncbi:LapA family protein [Virgibacillus doumboii]|uniref:LapA family protein n=1 Tax=Virgibacillus doumboii TaxID=2697503 RepID=UPI0013E0C2C0|nr:lipopolysaccharide assembly protein LapA domain-containing protein [Virgibacillus doumboii]